MAWDSGGTNSYRMGKEGKYDLKLARTPSPPPSVDETVHGPGNYFKLIKNLLRIISNRS